MSCRVSDAVEYGGTCGCHLRCRRIVFAALPVAAARRKYAMLTQRSQCRGWRCLGCCGYSLSSADCHQFSKKKTNRSFADVRNGCCRSHLTGRPHLLRYIPAWLTSRAAQRLSGAHGRAAADSRDHARCFTSHCQPSRVRNVCSAPSPYCEARSAARPTRGVTAPWGRPAASQGPSRGWATTGCPVPRPARR